MSQWRTRTLAALAALFTLPLFIASGPAVSADATAVQPGRVLIYGPSLATDVAVNEETIARALGYDVAIADRIAWRALRERHFARYDAIIVGDKGCSVGRTGYLGTAAATQTRWTPAVTGNVALIATDPVFHLNFDQGLPAARTLIENGLKYATAGESTGAYLSLGCAYFDAGAFTPVPLLAGFGPFTVRGQYEPPFTGCPDTVNVVRPGSPLVAGLSGDDLSGWGCSIHAGVDSYPYPFVVVAQDKPTALPYLLTRPPTSAGASDRVTVYPSPTLTDSSPRSTPSAPNIP